MPETRILPSPAAGWRHRHQVQAVARIKRYWRWPSRIQVKGAVTAHPCIYPLMALICMFRSGTYRKHTGATAPVAATSPERPALVQFEIAGKLRQVLEAGRGPPSAANTAGCRGFARPGHKRGFFRRYGCWINWRWSCSVSIFATFTAQHEGGRLQQR